MIHIFNRKQLLADFDISIVAQAREILKQQGIPVVYKTKRGDDHVAHAVSSASKGGAGSFPKIHVHIIYVQKKDYKTAKEILHNAKLM